VGLGDGWAGCMGGDMILEVENVGVGYSYHDWHLGRICSWGVFLYM